jgi:hypothetical protein
MSYAVCLFAVKAEGIGEPALLSAITEVIADLDAELRLPVVMVRLADPSVAERTGERFFVLETRGGDRSLARAPFLERLSAVCAVSAFGHDDHRGVHVYERCGDTRGPRRLVSVGPFLEGDLEALGALPYPQRGLTEARLRELVTSPSTARSVEERAIAVRYATALDLGLAANHPLASRHDLLAPLRAQDSWLVLQPGKKLRKPKAMPTPRDARGLFDAAPARDVSTDWVPPVPSWPSREMTPHALNDATNQLHRAIAVTHPRDPWAYIARARAQLIAGHDMEDALADARRAIELDAASIDLLREEPELTPFFHVPELRDMLGLPPQPRPTWDRELARVPGPIVHRVGADPTRAELCRLVGSELEPLGAHIDVKLAYYRVIDEARRWLACSQGGGKTLVVRLDGTAQRELVSLPHLAPVAITGEGAVRLERGRDLPDAWTSPVLGFGLEPIERSPFAWIESRDGGSVVCAWSEGARRELRVSPVAILDRPYLCEAGWLWLEPSGKKGSEEHTVWGHLDGVTRELAVLVGMLPRIHRARDGRVLLFHGGAWSRLDLRSGELVCLARGEWGRVHRCGLSPSGARAFLLERLGAHPGARLVLWADGALERLPLEGLAEAAWLDDHTLAVSDLLGHTRLVTLARDETPIDVGPVRLLG